jgi:hypothetical protein
MFTFRSQRDRDEETRAAAPLDREGVYAAGCRGRPRRRYRQSSIA